MKNQFSLNPKVEGSLYIGFIWQGQNHAHFEIDYSLESVENVSKKLNGVFDYSFIVSVTDVISSYNLLRIKLEKNSSDGLCNKDAIDSILKNFKAINNFIEQESSLSSKKRESLSYLSGTLIVGLNKLRNVKPIELRNGFNHKFDSSVEFYSRIIGKELFTYDLSLKRFERAKRVSRYYANWEVFYCLEKSNSIPKDFLNRFQFLTIKETSDLPKELFQLRNEWNKESKVFNCIQIRKVTDLIKDKTNFTLGHIENLFTERTIGS